MEVTVRHEGKEMSWEIEDNVPAVMVAAHEIKHFMTSLSRGVEFDDLDLRLKQARRARRERGDRVRNRRRRGI